MKFMVLKGGDQRYEWVLQGGGTLLLTTHLLPFQMDDPPDPSMAVAYVLQTDVSLKGVEGGRYTIECTYGSMTGEKIEGAFGERASTLNLQPGDYEIVIYNGSNDVLAGEFASPVGNGC